MPVTINGSNTPTAGGVTYGDGTQYATTSAGTSGQALLSAGSSAPTWGTPASATTATNLAGGSAGTVPYQSASGTTAMLAAGTSGQVLQSNGASAPSWVTPGGGSWVYLSTVTASGSATADVETTFSSTYDMYAIVAENVVMSADTSTLQAGMKIGGSYLTTGTYYWVALRPSAGTPSTPVSGSGGTDTRLYIMGNMSSSASGNTAFVAYIPTPSSTSVVKSIFINGAAMTSGTFMSLISMAGYNTGTSALTGVRFYGSAGNISGTFRLYGIKNS